MNFTESAQTSPYVSRPPSPPGMRDGRVSSSGGAMPNFTHHMGGSGTTSSSANPSAPTSPSALRQSPNLGGMGLNLNMSAMPPPPSSHHVVQGGAQAGAAPYGYSNNAVAGNSGAYNGSGSMSASPALAYANAQLSHYAMAAQASPPPGGYSVGGPGASSVPSHLNPHALSSALSDYSNSLPGSAASSPGAHHKRLPASGTATGASTPGGFTQSNSRVAASSVTGKRLNWSEMICQTIAESESGHLVIQDLFESMCGKFPEIREWAYGKDWEGRVKNRIKSTLSIKGNLFIKVPRPSTAAGKGSWWTLSAEAQDAWKEGRVASVIRQTGSVHGHGRSASAGRHSDGPQPLSTANSRGPSRTHSRAPSRRGSPVSSRGPSSQHAQHAGQHAQAHSAQKVAQHAQQVAAAQQTSAGLNFGPPLTAEAANAQLTALGLGMGGLGFGGSGALDGMVENANQLNLNERRMRAMENSVNEGFSAGMPGNVATSMYTVPFGAGTLPLGSAGATHMGPHSMMPFPAASDGLSFSSPTSSDGVRADAPRDFQGDLSAALLDPFGSGAGYNFDLGVMNGMDGTSSFGNMQGAYSLLGNDGSAPTTARSAPASNSHPNSNGGSGSGGRGTPSAGFHIPGSTPLDSSSMLGASPADSSSPWLSYGATGSAGGSGHNSAPGMSPSYASSGFGNMQRRGSEAEARSNMPPPQQQQQQQQQQQRDQRDGQTPTPHTLDGQR